MSSTFTVKEEGLERIIRKLKLTGPQLLKAERRAVNKTATGVRTDIVREVRKILNVKAKDVRAVPKIRKASYTKPSAEISLQGEVAVPLFSYAPRPSRPESRKPKAGVSVMVRKDNGRKPVARAFIARMQSGHVGVFQRIGKKRLGIKELYGPNIMAYLGQRGDLMDQIISQANARLSKNMKHELEFALRNLK